MTASAPRALVLAALAVLAGCAAAGVVPAPSAIPAVPAVPADAAVPAVTATHLVAAVPASGAVPATPAEPAKTVAEAAASAPPGPAEPAAGTDVADKKAAAMVAAPATPVEGGTGAIGVAGVGPSETCKENGDCKVPNSYCKSAGKGDDGTCHCQKDFVFSGDGKRCLQEATAEKPACEQALQCVRLLRSAATPAGGAACVQGQCRCHYDHEHVNGTCVLKKARGKACAADAECADLDGGACIQGVCSCKDDYVPAVASNKCLSVLHALGEACDEDIQCSEGLGDLGRCSAGKCACADGAALGADKKCACAADEEFNKVSTRCERSAPGSVSASSAGLASQQQAAKEAPEGKGGAASLQSSAIAVLAVVSSCALALLAL